MTKITLNDLVSLENETSAINTINNNMQTLVDAFDNTLSRDGTTPNQLNATFDVNSHRIINLAVPVNPNDAARLQDINDGGPPGPTGPSGSSFLFGSGVPSNTLGSDGDEYLDIVTSNVYGKVSGAWIFLVNIQGPTGSGSGDMLRANNLSDLVNKPTALTNIGGQPVSALLTALAGVSAAANELPYFTGSSAASVTSLTAYARTLLAGVDAPSVLTLLGVAFGTATGTYAQGNDSRFYSVGPVNNQTGNYTFALTDRGILVRNTSGSGVNYTLPALAYTAGDTHLIRNTVGSGNITLSPAGGVTMYKAGFTTSSGSVTITAGGYATLINEASGTWFISGSGVN